MRTLKFPSAIGVTMVALALSGLVACGDAAKPAATSTAVLGNVGSAPRAAASATLTDSQGRPITPPAPRGAGAQVVRIAPDAAVAVWTQDDRIVSATYTELAGWTAALPLEEIHGEGSRPQLAGNGQGVALALWQHTVGSIQSLRFSRYDAATGWSVPDVMPGALPRPPALLRQDAAAPQLHMDAQGNAFAQWPSGFAENEVQTARYTVGQGWTRALSEPVTASASPAPGQPASTVQ